jgi:hypothetical protein
VPFDWVVDCGEYDEYYNPNPPSNPFEIIRNGVCCQLKGSSPVENKSEGIVHGMKSHASRKSCPHY